MDFTREPIIETIITPKEGCKIVVRSSKSSGQEEYFVDSVEVVSFGNALFFRSIERPKAFLVPVSDYEILEVREARMVLKNVGIDRAIKIGGGRDAQMRAPKEQNERSEKTEKTEKAPAPAAAENGEAAPNPETKPPEKKRDRRRQYRRRRGRDGAAIEEEDIEEENKENGAKIELAEPRTVVEGEEVPLNPIASPSILTSLLPPPPTLISETIARYKDNALFRDAFYSRTDEKFEEVHISESEGEEVQEKAEEQKQQEGEEQKSLEGEKHPIEERSIEESEAVQNVSLEETIPLSQPAYGSFEVSEEEEEEIYQQRKRGRSRNQAPVPVKEVSEQISFLHDSPFTPVVEESSFEAPKEEPAQPLAEEATHHDATPPTQEQT